MSVEEIKINRIVRSRRRTIALVVTEDAMLVVRAPYHTPLEYIKNLVGKKSAWIRRKISEMPKRGQAPAKEFENGEKFFHLGKQYDLCIVENTAADVELKDHLCLAQQALPEARNVLMRWYRSEALKKITERCRWYATMTGCTPSSLKITGARKRWGSCGAKGSLNFSWRLIMAPPEVIDYVIVHELIHIGQMDHSKQFWNKVGGILPDYAQQRKWLREHDRLLTL